MTPEVGTELINPHAGTKTVFLATAESTAGAYVEIEVTYPPDSAKPPLLKHPAQVERFTALAGQLNDGMQLFGVISRYDAEFCLC